MGRARHRLEQFRDLATRYAKRPAYYRAEILIAATILWLREDPQDTHVADHVDVAGADVRLALVQALQPTVDVVQLGLQLRRAPLRRPSPKAPCGR